MENEVLYRYFEGATTEQENIEVMEWAESSSENYKEYLNQRQVWCALLLHSKPEKARKTVLKGGIPLRHMAGFVAAVLLTCVVVTLFVAAVIKFGTSVQRVVVPSGQRVEMTLADGSRVWLNSKSRFEYSTLFGFVSRKVRLSGEGYFEVAKRRNKPFIVTTENYDIKVHGTTFNVYAFDGSPTFEAALIEGCIEVSPHNSTASMFLSPNQMAVATAGGELKRVPLVDRDRLRWIEGMICLSNVTFGELIERFSSYFDAEIRLTNPKLYDIRCTGKFRQSDGVDYSLRVLQNLVDFNYTFDNKNNVIEIY